MSTGTPLTEARAFLAACSSPSTDQLNGDVVGYWATTIVKSLQTYPVSATLPTSGQILKSNGSQWAPAAYSSHTQNTDNGTTSATFGLTSGYSYGNLMLVSSSVNTSGTGWTDVYAQNISSYWVIAYRLIVAARDTITNYGAAFTVEGVIKRGNAANTTAYIENPATVTRLGSDYAGCAYFQVNVVENTTTAQLQIQVKAVSSNLTRWTCMGEALVII